MLVKVNRLKLQFSVISIQKQQQLLHCSIILQMHFIVKYLYIHCPFPPKAQYEELQIFSYTGNRNCSVCIHNIYFLNIVKICKDDYVLKLMYLFIKIDFDMSLRRLIPSLSHSRLI